MRLLRDSWRKKRDTRGEKQRRSCITVRIEKLSM